MALIIPTSNVSPHYRQVTRVDGVDLRFFFDWNGRRARWMVSIFVPDTDEPILVGRTITDGWPLNLRSRDARLPRGFFIAYDQGGAKKDPGFAELHASGRTPLFFVPVEA
jgi:hypothetical protein